MSSQTVLSPHAISHEVAVHAGIAEAPRPAQTLQHHRAPSTVHHRHFGILIFLPIALLCLMGGGILLINKTPHAEPATASRLIAQITAAAHGSGAVSHAYGGALSVDWHSDDVTVTAERVPPKACLQTGWVLAQKGTVTVNNIYAPRLTAAKLAEMCNLSNGGAKIVWTAPR
jgi:hypothetical protein